MVRGKLVSLTIQTSIKFRDFEELYITFKVGNFTNLKALFLVELLNFP